MTQDPLADDWRALNRANWDERVAVHLPTAGYSLDGLRAGRGRLEPIEEAELGSVDGQRIIHLQCHFGRDTLTLAQRGAEVVGVDFSPPAIATAQRLSIELGLSGRARFVLCDLYAAPEAVGEAATFDRVYVTWGAINWLPDIAGWARVVAHFLKPGGTLYLAESHPSANVFDDRTAGPDGRPGFFAPYFDRAPLLIDDQPDYADPDATIVNRRTIEWVHPLGDIIGGLIGAGLTLKWYREHDAVPWQMFECLVADGTGLYRWPDRKWLPLAFSLEARKPG